MGSEERGGEETIGGEGVRELVIETGHPEETAALGRKIGSLIDVSLSIALTGELGTGKTVLAKGICEGLGVRDLVTSPSFIIVNDYEGRLPVHHVDLYRVETEAELESTGLDDLLGQDGVAVIEWAEKAAGRIPPPVLEVLIEYAGTNRRKVRLTARGKEAQMLLERLGAAS